MPDNVDKLFEIMQAKGAASDRNKFRKVFLTPGNKGYKIRKDIYDGLRADGIIDSPTYEDFRRKLRLGGTPTVNKYRQQMFNSVDPNKSRASELTHRAVGQAVRATNNVRKPVTAKVVNQKGKPTGKEFAITPAKTVEDLDREYAQETTKNWENELHDQMADADKDAAKISDMFKSFIGSTDEVGSVWGNMTRGGGIAGTPHSVTTNNGILENTEARQILAAGDYNRKRRELLQLEQDSRNGAIFDNHSFFRGMYDAAKDTGFLTGGASDLINAGSLLATKQDLDNGVHTEAGDMLMQQAVKNSDAQSQYGDNQGWMYTGGVITTNMAPFMVQIGSAGFSKGMSNAIGKVVQGAASKVALGTMEKATGIAGAHIANYIGKVTGLTTKAFGKAIQYGIVGAAQANTVGLGNVANDVINRYTGQVYQDEQGNYKFGTFDSDGKLVHEGGEDFLTALVKGEAAQTIEFATELAGGGIDAAGTALKNFVTKGGKKIINKYNMENVSKVIDFLLNNKVAKNARYLKAGADRTLGKVEVNSIVGESLEEELGIIANTVFTGDNKISDLWDEKQQSQIWGGMLLSIGLMKGAVAPFHAYNAKQYYSYKHKLDKADVNLSQLLGKEKWEELRNQIDATTNEDMPEMVNKINRDVALGRNRQPVREYIQNLLIMRGYDIGNMLAAKKAVEDKGEGVSVKNMEKNQAYQQGRDAYGYDTHEIQLDQEDKQKSLAQLLGISEQQLASMSDEELDALSGRDDNIDRAIYDYQLSTARYEGVIDNAKDQIDLEVQRAAQAVDMYTDKSRNTIRNATIKATGGLKDYGVYIINGNIATHEDGSIDISNSDDMILYYDPTTNTVEHADAMMFAELGSEENADEVRSLAMADAKEKAIKETTGIIDGVVEVGTQFKTIDADGTEHTYEVLADNGDGTAMITIDGNIPTELVKGENVNVPVSFEELQKMKDASDQQRLQAAKAQREQMEKERAEQQTQVQTAQAQNPAQESNTQSAPIEDNLDYSDIIREDGKVQMVDVSDKDGNNFFPDAKDVFYIQGNKMRTKFAYIDANGELKTQSFPTGLVKIKTRGEVSVDDYKKYRNMILSAESSAMPESSMIEDNSGENRGEIEVETPTIEDAEPIGTGAFGNIYNQFKGKVKEAFNFLMRHKSGDLLGVFHRDDVGDIDLVWGNEKMGLAHILGKHVGEGKDFETPDDAIAMIENVINGGRIFQDNENRYTLMLDGVGVGIRKSFDGEKKNWIVTAVDFNRSQEEKGIVTNPTSTSHGVTESESSAALNDSDGKDINNSANDNENNESLTFEDGTPIPVDENGETDLSQTDAAHAAEWYDNNLGEDADDWLDGEIKKAKKVLEQAQNKKVTGTKPSELVASKKEKEAAIADAQAHYDSAISIRDSLKERRIAKKENTAEGRKELIEKARRKLARLKSAVKDDAEAVAQLYKDTVGSLLHRLYDGTGIDVTDTIPLTAEEYVASNLGAHSLNYEGTETSKGVKQETGLSREDFAKTQLLAADGKGTTIDNLVHSLWENRPSNLESLGTQEIRNALLDIITSGFKASEARNYIENLRIAQAENILEEQKKAADNAAYADEQKAKQEEEEKKKAEEDEESSPLEGRITETDEESEVDGEYGTIYNKVYLIDGDKRVTKVDEPDEKGDYTGSYYMYDGKRFGDLFEVADYIDGNNSENINEKTKFPDKLRESSKAIEVPEDATDENPLGLQLSEDKVPFEIEGGKSGETYDISDKEDRQRLINDNKVDNKDILDIDMPKHVHKAITELCKKMGLKVQFLYMGARSNGWIEDGTMYLALDTEKATQFVFGHEMTHAIKQKNPEAYKELVKVAMAVTTRKKFEEDLAKVYQNYYGISGYNNIDDYVEEVVADNLGKFINDFDLAQKFSLRLNHPVLATILHAIQKIKSLLYGDFYKSVDALERIVEKAYVDTANGQVTNSETGEDVSFSLRQKPEPKKKGIGYKVFVLKDGKLYPPMVANPNGAATPVGVWLDADAAPIAGESKTGRPQVKQGGKGTQGGSGKLAYRPGWHLGVVPYAIQFNRKDADGNKTLFPKNFVFAEVEYAADVDYQEEARQEGINPSGKYQHSLAGLKHLPTDGYYMYRTNPNPETDPWVITGAMKVNRILTRAEQAELMKNAGREPQQIQEGDIVTDDVVNSINQEIADAPKFSLKVYHGSGADFTEFDFDHMGEGAGSQAFGWGGYVTSSKKIGKSYANLVDANAPYQDVEYVGDNDFEYKDVVAGLFNGGQRDYDDVKEFLQNGYNTDKENARKKQMLEWFESTKPSDWKSVNDGKRNLYEVDIPDDNGSNYLDWDAPITDELIDKVAKALPSLRSYDIKDLKKDRTFDNFYKTISMRSAKDDATFNDDKAASQLLASLGYTGIKYKAGRNFGGAEEGDTNYVIFNPEDMRITEHTKFSIKTYHGSQASFDKFDHSFMGSGEGAQAYGWGTYVSEVEGIAKAYAKANAKKNAPSRLMYQGKPMTYKTPTIIYQVAIDMDKFNISAKEAISKMIDADEKKLASVGDTPFAKMKAKQVQDELKVLKDLNPSDFKINEDYDTIAQDLVDTKSGLDLLEDELRDAKSYVDLYQSRLDEAKEELSKAKESGTGLGVDMYESDVEYYSEQVKRYKQSIKTKESDIKDVKTKVDALQKKLDSMEKPRNLYSVDIPDDTGKNYLDWDGRLPKTYINRVNKALEASGHKTIDTLYPSRVDGKLVGQDLYDRLRSELGSQKAASLLLKDAGFVGVKVIAQRNTGGNKKGMMNYVIFDENNAQITSHTKFSLRLKSAIDEAETNPSDAQKESGNYKKGHIKFGGYDYTIENPKGSTRSGKDADGKEWKVTMHDTYGYIRGKFGKDGDHLDMFINDKADLDNWNGDVFVVDQVNPDGSFDEHKVMYGYDSLDDAKKAYLANYSDGWQGLGNITGVSKDEFDKWLDTSNRKLKPFADYAKVKFSQAQSVNNDAPKTFEEFLNHPSLKFSIKNEEQRKAAEDAYEYAAKLRPNKYAQYALVDMSNPSNSPEYYEKKVLADRWRRFYNKAVNNELDDVYKDAWGNYKLFDLDRPFADQVNEVKGDVPSEFNAPDVTANKNADNESGAEYHEYKQGGLSSVTYKDRYNAFKQREANREKTAGLRKERKEVEDAYKSKSEERIEYNKQLMKEYMDNHGLSSENDIPYDVWDDLRSKSFEKYQDELDSLFNKYKDLDRQINAVAEPRFSLKDEKTLAGVHNITEEKLLKAIKQGGLANPSVAVIDSSKQNHENYGDISLILPSDKVAKRTGKNAGTWQGDAWTPTYPQVERQMSNKGAEKASKDVASVPNDMYSEVRRGLDRWLDGGEPNSAIAYMFLHEKGVAPEPKKIQPKFSDEAYNELKSITAGDFNIYGIGKSDAQKVLDMYIEAKFDGDKDLYEEKTTAWLERNKAVVDAGTKGGMRYAIAKENVELYDEYGFNYNGVQTFVRDVEYDHRKTGIDMNATLNEVENYMKTNNLTDEFNAWLEGKEKEYGIKEVIFDGFTPSGNRRYVPNTLENVSKIMKKQGRNGATGAAVSFQNFAAKLMPSYGTLKDIRSKKNLLTSDHEDLDKFNEKWANVFFELGMKCQPDATGTFDDYGLARLSEAAMTSDPQAYLKKEYNVDFSDEDTKRLKEMVKAIKEEYPAMYFETKFERPVGFDEFSSAVVPTTASDEVKQALQNAGVQIYEYDKEKEGDRSRAFNEAINSSDNIRFSLAGERGAAAADKAEERTFRMDNLSVAKDMEKNKKKAKTIKAATGWERGADGKWRYEMPDVVLRSPKEWVNKKTLTLSDIVEKPNDLFKEYPELFDAYPELKDMKILKGRAKSGGVFYNNAITLNLGDIREAIKYDMDTHYKLANNSLKKTLVHEIQHYIQEQEGFAQGGNSEMIIDKNALDAIAKLRAEKDAVAKEFYAMSPEEQQRRKYEINKRYNDLTKQIERLEKSSRIGYDGYNRLSGEVEARNVSARLNMTPEERRKSLAESTEDVARKDQIFLGVGDVSFSLRDMADGNESGAADMAEDLKSLNTPDEVDDAVKTAIDDMPSGWKMANKKMIHIAQALGENRKAEIAGEEPKFSLKDGSLIKAGTYFSGGGLVEEGLKGIIDPVLAVEYDEKISGVYRNNFGQHIVTADVRDVDPRELVKQIDGEVEYFHASPVCKNYSQAKSNHAEVELDKETAASTAEFINAIKPKVVTIENVKGYKDSDAMKTITDALDANGYTWDADVYNAADYGGYTNRERLIVRAVRDGKLPAKPKKMAHKSGWYEAVADIIPTLTEKKNGVAPWMDVRLKADGIDWRNIDKPLYVMGSAYADGKVPHAFADELLPTLRTKSGDVIVMPDGKVYRAMGRVLARVSGVSDDYKMPFSENLSHTIIGNGIPTQLTEHVIAPLLTGSDPKFSIRTYHGTGASFDKFDFSHMGEGEGSQAFGWGGYVTNSKEIAEDYTRRAKMRKDNGGFEFVTDLSDSNKDMVRHYIYKYKDVDKGLDAMRKDLSSALEMFPDDDNLKELSDILAKKNEEIAVPDDIAYLYDVDIPDDNGDYLDWENKLKKSHLNKVNKELVRIGKEPIETIYPSRVDGKVRGQDLYDELSSMLGSKEAASKLLSDAGFVGIKYPAGTIFGGAKKDDYNYVIFDENNANIVGNTRFSLRGSTPYDKQMEEWMEKNNLEKGAVPMEKPIMKEGENIFDYANRMVEWTRNQNLWKTAPKQTGFQDALDKWKADNGLSPDAYPPVRPHREYYSSEIGYTEDLEEYNKKKELWKSAPKPKDFDLSVDLEDMNKQLRNIRRAVLNQKNYDQRTVKAVSDLVRKMLSIGWGDGLSRGKVGNLLSAAKNATGANDAKKYLDKAMGILAENYLNRLSTAYDNLINTKGARADQSGVIKMGSLDAKGQSFMSEYKKAINMDEKSLNTYIANIEEDSAKNEDNVEMNDYRLAGIQAAIMYKQQIGGNDADISELKRQIGELKNKKDATKEDKDLLKSLEKKLFENKFDRITMYENLLNNIQRMVKESKGRAKEFREQIAEHKNEILHLANLDLEGVDSTYYDTTTAKKKLVNNDLQRAVFSSTYTFEQFLKFFGKKAANGEGRLYNYFTKLNQDALDEEQLYNEMNRNALDEKTKELFGNNKFMNLVGIDGKGMKEMDVEVTDYSNKETGKRTIHLKQGQMLYIYLVNKETDGEMKLRAMGITEEDVAAIEENLDPKVKAMGEWLQDEYLPECQRRYQATHTKYFGAPMKEVENYFPLAINNRARNVKEDVNQDSDAMSQLAGTSTGAIVTRRVNVIPLDIENADAFEVAFNHLQEMEEWSAMLPFRQDINTLLSYTHFRNQVQNMSSVAYGSGKTLWDEFKQTAQIAAGTYKPKVNAGMMDSRIAAAMGGIAVAKISGRLWTAIKQSQSATVFLPECDFTRFVKNGVNPYGSWKWAMENIPDFRKRVESMTYGDVKLRQYLDELEKWHDWTKTISKIGMAPNILVDGITCAVGARSVYETEVNRLTKLGYPKEKAEEKAYYKAVAAYNKTQQSSGGMYLSPMQVDRTYVSAALSLFKNANYAYGRMQIEACRGLARTYDFWGGKHKTALIESMTRQIMEEDGLDENTARAIAKATYNRTFKQSIGRLINFATLVPISWALYKVLPYLLTGDDDDKKTDMIEEAVLKGFATSLSDNYVIPFASNILNAGLKVEDGKPTFDPEVFRYQNLYINPATSDLANIYSMVGNQKWYSVANKLGMLGVQSLIGFNPETVGALYQAFAEADYDNGNTAKEWQIGILKTISAPEESIRELYMDELGLKSGDIKKITLAELEKRYAERQINRDNLLSQIGMDAETFNGYVDKYQKSFEKKIKDKMDKWDEYDKKKADEFFDTTSDPKLKDMIAKKRTKDANAAADEQIAKEGLNQEKKGKEPSEEAYDAVKMSIDVAEDNAISAYYKVLNKRYAALNDEYNNQSDAMKFIFMSKHPNFKAYKELESEYTNYGKKIKELKEQLVSAKGYDAKQAILKQIRSEREKFDKLQSNVK